MSRRQTIIESYQESCAICSKVWLGRILALAFFPAAKRVPRKYCGISISEMWGMTFTGVNIA
jgi:hypothetical protein